MINRLVQDAERLEDKLIAIRHPTSLARTKRESQTGDVGFYVLDQREPLSALLDGVGLSTDVRTMEKTTIMRAFELARSGACERVSDIRTRLHAENYDDVNGTMAGPSLQAQLKALMKTARKQDC